MGDQSSRQYRRHPGHDALKNDNKFRNEKSPCMQRNVCGGDFAVFDMAAETGMGLQQFLEAFDIPDGK